MDGKPELTPKKRKLHGKQARFVEEYLKDLNGTRAAIDAGYSAKTAASMAAENLRKPHIQEAISEAIRERSQRTGVEQDYVLKWLQTVLEFALEDFYDDNYRVMPLSEIPREKQMLIQQVKRSADGSIDFVFVSKDKAIELLGRHLGLFAGDRDDGKDNTIKIELDDTLKSWGR